MIHVTPETARRLKEAGFPQNITTGFYFVESYTPSGKARKWGGIVFKCGIDYMLCGSFSGARTLLHNCHKTVLDTKNAFFAPSATDIMQHLPGWNLAYTEAHGWTCFWEFIDRAEFIEFYDANPAEAAAEAWFFEHSRRG